MRSGGCSSSRRSICTCASRSSRARLPTLRSRPVPGGEGGGVRLLEAGADGLEDRQPRNTDEKAEPDGGKGQERERSAGQAKGARQRHAEGVTDQAAWRKGSSTERLYMRRRSSAALEPISSANPPRATASRVPSRRR